MRSARGRARGAQCRAPRQVPGRCDDGQIPRPRGDTHVKAFVPEGRVPDSPTPTIMLNVKWHDLDRPCCRDGANGSRSALRELFNYAHVIPIFERGDAPGPWRSRRGGWCPMATTRGVRNTASSRPSVGSHPHAVGHVFGPIADGEQSVVLEQLSDIAPCVPGDSFQRFVSIHP